MPLAKPRGSRCATRPLAAVCRATQTSDHLVLGLLQDEVQKKMDKCVKELEDLAKAKEKELNTV